MGCLDREICFFGALVAYGYGTNCSWQGYLYTLGVINFVNSLKTVSSWEIYCI